MDTDGNGKIEEQEFTIAINNVSEEKFSKEDIHELMCTLDTNKNGYIDYTEFLAGCMRSKIYLNEELVRCSFEYFDIVRFKYL